MEKGRIIRLYLGTRKNRRRAGAHAETPARARLFHRVRNPIRGEIQAVVGYLKSISKRPAWEISHPWSQKLHIWYQLHTKVTDKWQSQNFYTAVYVWYTSGTTNKEMYSPLVTARMSRGETRESQQRHTVSVTIVASYARLLHTHAHQILAWASTKTGELKQMATAKCP